MASWGYFPRSTPKPSKGGIKAQSKRGDFGQSWWARRWIEALESFNIGARLGRGRSYARSGQVLSIDIEEGIVKAKVQGSRSKPYNVTIKIEPLPESDWKKLVVVLSSQAIFAAKLLFGEMPQDIEQAFKEAGLSLFPQKSKDLETECSCPDWSNPCKHIAAVYYLLGEEFDRSPFLIFKLRGKSKEALLAAMGEAGERDARLKGKSAAVEAAPCGPAAEAPAVEPLAADPRSFWSGSPLSGELFGEVAVPPMAAALLKRLGGFPFWRASRPISEALADQYCRASQRGLDTFLGESARTPASKERPTV